jgi:16S rRNA (adenine1518-N6/adenine1519-N6)-dimethyltransferase
MRPKKSLGQNFLNSSKAIREIVSSGEVKKGETILEIGPGKGVLTRALMNEGAHVVAIEKDDQLIIYLNELFKEEIKLKKLTLIHADVLDLVDKEKMSPNLP